MAKRSILLNGQVFNTAYAVNNTGNTRTFYGLLGGAPIFQNSFYTSGGLLSITGNPVYTSGTGDVQITLAVAPNPPLAVGWTVNISGVTGTGANFVNGPQTVVSNSGTTLHITIGTSLGIGTLSGGTVNVGQGNLTGAYEECGYACVLSRVHHTIGAQAGTMFALTTAVNVGGQVAINSAASVGAGNLAASTPTPGSQINNSTYWYDSTHLDALTAGQQVGMMQTMTSNTSGVTNPSIGVVCDAASVSAFSVPTVFSSQSVAGTTILSGPEFGRLSGNTANAWLSSSSANTQDFSPSAFVASYFQWLPSLNIDNVNHNYTGTFEFGSTLGGATAPSSPALGGAAATLPSPGFSQLMRDNTHITAVPAGSFCTIRFTGNIDVTTHLKVGSYSTHIRPANPNSSWLVSGIVSNTNWTSGFANTFTSLNGVPRDDKLYTENMQTIPSSGVFMNLTMQTGVQNGVGNPSTVTVWNGAQSGDDGSTNGIYSTLFGPGQGVIPGNFTSTGLSVTLNTASVWLSDLTHIATFTQWNGFLLAINNPTNQGSTDSFNFQGYSVNFITPATDGLLLRGAG